MLLVNSVMLINENININNNHNNNNNNNNDNNNNNNNNNLNMNMNGRRLFKMIEDFASNVAENLGIQQTAFKPGK